MFKNTFDKLETYITKENFKGYDPYSTFYKLTKNKTYLENEAFLFNCF